MPVTRADELDARPADNAKELQAHDKRALGIIRLATEQAEELRALRLSARQQASVEEVAKSLCEACDDHWWTPSNYKENQKWWKRGRALLAKYDIFEKVEP